jgi:hypothetical protein
MDIAKEFDRYMAHLMQGLGHADRHSGLTGYFTGLMLPLSRKSVEPMAARVDPLHASARHQSLHHFVAKAPVERSYRARPALATGKCEPVESERVERHLVCRRAGLQVARPAQALRQLAHHLHADESLVQKRRAGPAVRGVAALPGRAHQDRSGVAGQHHREGTPRWHRSVKNTAPNPSASPEVAGPPRFIWLPRMLERP